MRKTIFLISCAIYFVVSMKTRKTLNDQKREFQKAHNFLGAMFGKEPMDVGVKDKQARTKKMLDSDREDDVLREVGQLLAAHPKVLFAVRQNSGMSYNAAGAPVYFYRWARSKVKMRISDFWGMLTNGRMFALECKNRTWTKPSGDREAEQQNFLIAVQSAGGVSGFCTSSEKAQEIIET